MMDSSQLANLRFWRLLSFFLVNEGCVVSGLSMLMTTRRIRERISGALSFLTMQASSLKLTSSIQ